MARRSSYDWSPEFTFWKRDGRQWYCEKADLEAAIAASDVTEEHQRRRMGQGFGLIARALAGERLTYFQVSMIEYSLKPDDPSLCRKGLSSP